jgi:PadR family transcriptional regulator, regulatory protein PadR
MMPKALGSASIRPVVLSVLARQDSYGYELIQYARELSQGSLDLQPGVLYPILRKLEKDGLIKSYWQQGEGERRRRYYSLTKKGSKALAVEKREWLRMHDALTRLWSREPLLAG